MKIDKTLVGRKKTVGFAMGLNEFAGYFGPLDWVAS